MKRILLVRHGQASVLADDYDKLSQLGRRQARLLGHAWGRSELRLDRLVVGPLVRHRESAEELLEGLAEASAVTPMVIDQAAWSEHQGLEIVETFAPLLAENDTQLARWVASLSELTGADRVRRYFEIYRRVSRLWAREELDLGASGLEAWSEFRSRVQSGLEALLDMTEGADTVAVMTSAGAVSMALGGLLGLADERILELSWVVRNSAVSEVRARGRELEMMSFNDLGHLGDPELVTFI